jgi:hypothetical protein
MENIRENARERELLDKIMKVGNEWILEQKIKHKSDDGSDQKALKRLEQKGAIKRQIYERRAYVKFKCNVLDSSIINDRVKYDIAAIWEHGYELFVGGHIIGDHDIKKLVDKFGEDFNEILRKKKILTYNQKESHDKPNTSD